jgi:hypothetical protein
MDWQYIPACDPPVRRGHAACQRDLTSTAKADSADLDTDARLFCNDDDPS